MKLIVLRGAPGSGKTALANKLATELGAEIIHVDSLKIEIHKSTADMTWGQAREKAYGATIDQLTEFNKANVNLVILEELLCDGNFVKSLEKFCNESNVDVQWFRIERNIDSLMEVEHSAERSTRKTRNSREDLESLDKEIKEIEIPGEIVINNDNSFEEAFAELNKNIRGDSEINREVFRHIK